MWYEGGSRKSTESGKNTSMWSCSSYTDIGVDHSMFDPNGRGFERRVNALLNHCPDGYIRWLGARGKDINRQTAKEYLLGPT